MYGELHLVVVWPKHCSDGLWKKLGTSRVYPWKTSTIFHKGNFSRRTVALAMTESRDLVLVGYVHQASGRGAGALNSWNVSRETAEQAVFHVKHRPFDWSSDALNIRPELPDTPIIMSLA
jgi:hypothetical protein